MTERATAISLTAQVIEFNQRMRSAAGATQEVTRAAAEAKVRLQEQNQAMTQVGTSLTAIGAVATAATALVVKAAIDWESAWAGVTKTVDGTPAQLQDIEDGLRSMARELPATHEELAGIAEAAGQLGIQREGILAFTKTMVDLSETTNLSADEAATSIAQLMNVMQTAPDDVDNLGASLVALGNAGASTERDIIQMAQRIAGAGKVVGLSEADVLGFANALASVGIDAEAGGSSISRVMTDMAMAVSEGGEELSKFAAVAGVSADEFATKFKDAPAEAIVTFIEGLGGINAAGGDVFKTLSDLGQTDIRVSQALLGMAGSGDLLRKSLDLGTDAWEDNTALLTEAEKRYETTASQIKVAQNNIDDAAITLGSVFLPVVAQASEAVSGFAEMVGSVPEPIAQIGGVLGVAAGGVALLAGAALLAIPKINETRIAVATLKAELATMPATTARASAALKAFTAVSIAGWAAGEVKNLIDMEQQATGVELSVEALSKSIDSMSAKAVASSVTTQKLFGIDLGNSKLSQYTDNGWWSDFGKQADGLKQSTKWLTDLNPMSNVLGLNNTLTGDMAMLDKELAAQVSSGNGAKAAAVYEELKAQTNGSADAVRKLNEFLPEYTVQAAKSSDSTAELAQQNSIATQAAEDQAAATEAQQKAHDEWVSSIQDSDSAFINLTSAYDAVIQKNHDWAQAQADDTTDAADSWEDYYDGVTVGFGDYLAQLQAQVDAQTNWESNMILLAGRVSEGTLQELSKLGPEAAPLVADMVNASDEELARMDTLFSERAASATGKFADTLTEAQTVIQAAAGQLGQDAADEIAAKLASGTATVEQIIAEYGIKISSIKPEIQISTAQAQANLDAFIAANNGSTIFLGSRVATGPGGTGGIPFASGGAIHGPGSSTSDDVPIWASDGEHMFDAEDVRLMGGQAGVYAFRAALQANGGMPSNVYQATRYVEPKAVAGGFGGSAGASKSYQFTVQPSPGMDELSFARKLYAEASFRDEVSG